jgi:hypothetical protein
VPADDLAVLTAELRASARRETNGEVAWPLADAPAVINSLADANRVVLGLDLRTYDPDGGVHEVPWSDHSGQSVEAARLAALAALERRDLRGDWVLITWGGG